MRFKKISAGADLFHGVDEVLAALADLQGHFQVIDRRWILFQAGPLGEAHGVLFRDEDGFDLKLLRGLVDLLDLEAAEAVVVREEAFADDLRALGFQYFDEAFRLGDAGHHHDGQILQERKRKAAFRVHAYQFRRFVIADQDVRPLVVFSNLLFQLFLLLFRQVPGLGYEDVVRAVEPLDGFPQKACGQDPAVAEGTVGVNKDHVLLAAQPQVLHAVVQDDRVHAEFPHGVAGAPDSVGVGYDHDVLEILGQHVGLVAGDPGAEEQFPAVADDLGLVAEFLVF